MIHTIGDPLLFASSNEWGGKGMNLLELGEVFNVPQGFVLASDGYRETTKGIREDIEAIVNNKNPEEAQKEISRAIQTQEIPRIVIKEIEKGLSGLDKRVLAVRSSAIDEDGVNHSFAGQHETILGVDGIDQVEQAIKTCYASLFSSTALRYRQTHGLPLPESIAIVVQELINSDTAGVVYTATRADQDALLIESVFGLCVGAVEGKAVDVYKITKSTYRGKSIQKKISGHKKVKFVYEPRGKRVTTIPCSNSETLSEKQVNEVIEIAMSIEEYNKIDPSVRKPADIEFCYLNNELYILQSRPITGLNFNIPNIVLPDLDTIIGTTFNVGNPGIIDGPVVVIEEVDHLGSHYNVRDNKNLQDLNSQFQAGYILVTPETNPTLDQYLTNCKGMVITEGGIMGHAGATAAEKGIPFIGSTENPNKQDVRAGLEHGGDYCLAANRDKGIFGTR